ncbi:sialic acid synthase [Nephila pilipes]|uniref:Sialic acid synthase n=1 Tax=Nephila pilipes TaxID=299642 RepID=A0A8X6U7T6_NEPPI|nr:sialic acid synthase [Nephila pilipes]
MFLRNRKSKEFFMEFEIAPGRLVGGNQPCFIIAEIGQNHQGDMEIAKQLIYRAVDCGVDCVKFQKSDLESRFTREILKRPYTSKNSWGDTYGEHRNYLEFTNAQIKELKQYAEKLGVIFSASAMDKESAEFLDYIGVPFFKIGSADTTNVPLLRYVSKFQKPLVISTGMTSQEDLVKMYGIVSKECQHIAILQCTSCYPVASACVNLNVLQVYADLFPQAVIGYSGHEEGIGISIAAITMGAKILERHITLDRSLKGSDHAASLEPKEFKKLVREIRNVEDAFGMREKEFELSEMPCYEKLGKTVVSSRNLQKGTILLEDMMDVKVAAEKGYDPINFYDLIGKKLKHDVRQEKAISSADLV